MEKGVSELDQSIIERKPGWFPKFARTLVFLLVEIAAIIVLHAIKINHTRSREKNAGREANWTRRAL